MYCRAKDMNYLREVEDKVRKCAEGAALATGCKVAFRYTAETYSNMVTNVTLAQAFAYNLTALGRKVETPEEKSGGGSTDMANVSHGTRSPRLSPSASPAKQLPTPGSSPRPH